MRGTTLRGILGALLGFVLLQNAYGEGDFHFQMPNGWENLADPEVTDEKAPRDMVEQARSGGFLIYAFDPESIARDRIPATMSATPFAKTFRMTESKARALAAAMARRYVNVSVDPSETKVVKLGPEDVALMVATLKTSAGQTRMLLYVIPGRTGSVVLAYGCQADRFVSYRPIFEASAMATTGAYNLPWTAAIDWWAVLLYGSAGIATVLYAGSRRRKPAAPAPTTVLPTTWECPLCKRHVPMRVSECRCGTRQPESSI
jgi:hypothetical protein